MKRKRNSSHRLSLTLLLSFVVLCVFLVTLLVLAVAILAFSRYGMLETWHLDTPALRFLLAASAASMIVGTLLITLFGRVPLRPFNKVIDAMNRLASGDFKARIHFSSVFSKAPVAQEFEKSFNTMAAELENTEALRSDFINNFSHEFKTPIVSIAGFAKLLKHSDLTEEERLEYLDIIESESMRLSYMATNILNMTKAENQTILTEVSYFNLSEQIRSVVLLLERGWTAKAIDLNVDFHEQMIYGNEELLKQVWLNLFDNAVKFTPYGGTIEITIQENARDVEICVMNTGSTIPPDKQERIFSKFYQADESHAAEGNGIGLAVVKKIVTLHNGSVKAESVNGCTVFRVTLPKKIDKTV